MFVFLLSSKNMTLIVMEKWRTTEGEEERPPLKFTLSPVFLYIFFLEVACESMCEREVEKIPIAQWCDKRGSEEWAV